jgi:glycosyltransferase involved in cell wall biosynthesis
MFFPAVYSWFPVPPRLPTMVTIHDAIPEHFPKMVIPDWKSRLFWKIKVRLAVWQSDRVLTVSRAAKQEITEYIGVDDSLIDVISEAPGPTFRVMDDPDPGKMFRQQMNIPPEGRLIVYVGGMAPHKNLHRFLDGLALAREHQDSQDVHLLIAGDFAGSGFHSNYDSLRKRLDGDQNLNSRVHFSGYVTDEQLNMIYNDAMAVTMPSLSEGFGLPAVEAMACGTPVLASDRGSLPEVVGEAGLYFDPYDVGAISRAIIEMSGDARLRQKLGEIAKARAATFTWAKAAHLTMGFLESMMETHADQDTK